MVVCVCVCVYVGPAPCVFLRCAPTCTHTHVMYCSSHACAVITPHRAVLCPAVTAACTPSWLCCYTHCLCCCVGHENMWLMFPWAYTTVRSSVMLHNTFHICRQRSCNSSSDHQHPGCLKWSPSTQLLFRPPSSSFKHTPFPIHTQHTDTHTCVCVLPPCPFPYPPFFHPPRSTHSLPPPPPPHPTHTPLPPKHAHLPSLFVHSPCCAGLCPAPAAAGEVHL